MRSLLFSNFLNENWCKIEESPDIFESISAMKNAFRLFVQKYYSYPPVIFDPRKLSSAEYSDFCFSKNSWNQFTELFVASCVQIDAGPPFDEFGIVQTDNPWLIIRKFRT